MPGEEKWGEEKWGTQGAYLTNTAFSELWNQGTVL